MPYPMKTLTAKQENFGQLVADGKTLTDAYREAYNSKASARVMAVEASRLKAMLKIAARIAELRRQSADERTLTRTSKRRILAGIAEDGKSPAQARIGAIKTDNEMTGDNAPEKTEIRVGPTDTLGELIDSIRQGKGGLGDGKYIPPLSMTCPPVPALAPPAPVVEVKPWDVVKPTNLGPIIPSEPQGGDKPVVVRSILTTEEARRQREAEVDAQ
jgi:hypothetical protein